MDDKIKIGLGSDAFSPTVDGVITVLKYYAQIINEKLGEAVVITPNNSNQQDYKFPYEIYRYKSLFTFGEGYPVGWPFNEQLAKDVINMNCDILHSHCPISTSYFFRRINRQKRIPQVLTYHTKYEYDIEERVPSRAVKRFAYNFLLNNINSADEVWVTSNGTAESLRKIGYQGDFIVMPNGCDLPKVNATDEEIAIIRRKHNLPTDVPVFIFVGRMMWYKNTKLILDACKILDGRGMDFRMIMIGMGPDENAIKKYAKKLMLDNKVIFAGQITDREELQIYYSASDLLVFPSTFDTNGLVVREAAASATASLLVEDSCAAERIVDCDTGFLCVETAHAIARKIEDIMPNKDLIKRVGKKAQDDIYISWDDAVSNAFDRYHVVIDNFNSTNHDKYKY